MSPQEPRRELLPSRLADVTPIAAIAAKADRFDHARSFDSTTYGSPGSATEWIGRAFRRHWWQILPLWLIGAATLWWFSPRWFPNSYEAASEVQIEAGKGGGSDEKGAANDFATFKETQARRIISPNIITAALRNQPELAKQLAARAKTDQETAILRGIAAGLQANTNLIRVSMTAADDDGLGEIVNQVITAYLAVATDFNEEGTIQRTLKYQGMLRAKQDQVAGKRAVVKNLVTSKGSIDATQGRERHQAAIDQMTTLSDQLLKTELDVVEEQTRFERLKQDEAALALVARPDSQVEADAVAAFYKLPEVIALTEPRDKGKQDLVRLNREPAKGVEADRKTVQARIDGQQQQINNLWSRLKPELIITAQNQPREKVIPESSKLEGRLNGLKARQTMLNQRLDDLKRTTLVGGSEVLALEWARQDLSRAEAVLETMTQTANQNEVQSNQPVARFRQEYAAKTTEKSASLPRWSVGIGGPLLWLLTLLSFFGLVEKRTGRILDPADLPSKARLNVIGLVPPLPKNRSRLGLGSAAQSKSQLDVERFIQSLDQLRVLVCGRGDRDGRPRRSLLITSAGENEGKSTLAAQLAERSVNAGLLTLLIDADLRNPTLSRMFDRPDSVGLANVLRGELLAEEAIGTVAEAGGFHFLPAGLIRDDLSRLLGSDRLGRLLESARESFDLVLVDSPPVLPVADALTIGQWVDGAILTVRHKVSRLPLVERASRQLASVGVTVLGAVVSGVKDRYAPYYGSRPAADPVRDDSVGSSV